MWVHAFLLVTRGKTSYAPRREGRNQQARPRACAASVLLPSVPVVLWESFSCLGVLVGPAVWQGTKCVRYGGRLMHNAGSGAAALCSSTRKTQASRRRESWRSCTTEHGREAIRRPLENCCIDTTGRSSEGFTTLQRPRNGVQDERGDSDSTKCKEADCSLRRDLHPVRR